MGGLSAAVLWLVTWTPSMLQQQDGAAGPPRSPCTQTTLQASNHQHLQAQPAATSLPPLLKPQRCRAPPAA